MSYRFPLFFLNYLVFFPFLTLFPGSLSPQSWMPRWRSLYCWVFPSTIWCLEHVAAGSAATAAPQQTCCCAWGWLNWSPGFQRVIFAPALLMWFWIVVIANLFFSPDCFFWGICIQESFLIHWATKGLNTCLALRSSGFSQAVFSSFPSRALLVSSPFHTRAGVPELFSNIVSWCWTNTSVYW